MEIEAKRARLNEFYAHFDDFKCLGKCQVFCSKVNFSPMEWELLSDKRTAKRLHPREAERIMDKRQSEVNWHNGRIDRKDDCDYLSPFGTCEIYSERPFNCRVFGAVAHASMICKEGCTPIMSVNKFMNLIREFSDVLIDVDQMMTRPIKELYTLARR